MLWTDIAYFLTGRQFTFVKRGGTRGYTLRIAAFEELEIPILMVIMGCHSAWSPWICFTGDATSRHARNTTVEHTRLE